MKITYMPPPAHMTLRAGRCGFVKDDVIYRKCNLKTRKLYQIEGRLTFRCYHHAPGAKRK